MQIPNLATIASANQRLLSTFQALHPDLLSILQVSSGARLVLRVTKRSHTEFRNNTVQILVQSTGHIPIDCRRIMVGIGCGLTDPSMTGRDATE
ncbi:hypothetical protein LENED_006835 [Lentinula edodes]|uniref:Uncharacterized protein n=1 Tax=Lentinula edodes TaxID=5353 RepID=A0A1Q3ECS0_LENED|nr:hypothetical protein LENED_006835 [Lentinula edodes]